MYYLFKVEKEKPDSKINTIVTKFKTLKEAHSAFLREWPLWKGKSKRRIIFITTNRSIIAKHFIEYHFPNGRFFVTNNIMFNYMFWTDRLHDGEVRYVFYTDSKSKAEEAKKFFKIGQSNDYDYMNTRKTLF
ncbi:MAG: hypothetical protein ACRCTZ_21605 [Sarcina sp.]